METKDKIFLAHKIMEWNETEYSDDCFQTNRTGPDSVINISDWSPDTNISDFNELVQALKERETVDYKQAFEDLKRTSDYKIEELKDSYSLAKQAAEKNQAYIEMLEKNRDDITVMYNTVRELLDTEKDKVDKFLIAMKDGVTVPNNDMFKIISALEYAAYNLTIDGTVEIFNEKQKPNHRTIESTGAEDSLLIALRDLKEYFSKEEGN